MRDLFTSELLAEWCGACGQEAAKAAAQVVDARFAAYARDQLSCCPELHWIREQPLPLCLTQTTYVLPEDPHVRVEIDKKLRTRGLRDIDEMRYLDTNSWFAKQFDDWVGLMGWISQTNDHVWAYYPQAQLIREPFRVVLILWSHYGVCSTARSPEDQADDVRRQVEGWWFQNLPPEKQDAIIHPEFEKAHPTNADKKEARRKCERGEP